jgi:hypothetical protein
VEIKIFSADESNSLSQVQPQSSPLEAQTQQQQQ